MVSSYKSKDYRSTHFEHKDLTKIHGRPDIDNLLQIFKELKRNAQKVPTNLGGGLLGYLGIVSRDVTYNTIPDTLSFVQPTHPGPCIPSGARLTQVEIIQ